MQPRRDALDLLPVDRVHVDDQVLEHGHVAHRLDDDRAAVLGVLGRVLEVGVAGQAGLAVDAHAAGAADRGAAGAADADRAVLLGLDLEDRPRAPSGGPRARPCTPARRRPRPTRGGSGGSSGCTRASMPASRSRSSGSHWVIVTGRVGHLGLASPLRETVMCLSHSSSLRSGKSVRNCAPRDSLRSSAASDDALGAVEHVPQLDRAQHVLVEDRAAVVDAGRLGLLLEPADDLQARAQARLVAEHRAVAVHRRCPARP